MVGGHGELVNVLVASLAIVSRCKTITVLVAVDALIHRNMPIPVDLISLINADVAIQAVGASF